MARRGLGGAALLAVLALALSITALASSGQQVPISKHARSALLRWALRTAKQNGDTHPYDVEVQKTTYLRAEELLGGDRSSGQADGATVYLEAMRGRFTAHHASIPPGAKAPTGTVLAAIFSRSLQVSDGYLGRCYPRLVHALRLR